MLRFTSFRCSTADDLGGLCAGPGRFPPTPTRRWRTRRHSCPTATPSPSPRRRRFAGRGARRVHQARLADVHCGGGRRAAILVYFIKMDDCPVRLDSASRNTRPRRRPRSVAPTVNFERPCSARGPFFSYLTTLDGVDRLARRQTRSWSNGKIIGRDRRFRGSSGSAGRRDLRARRRKHQVAAICTSSIAGAGIGGPDRRARPDEARPSTSTSTRQARRAARSRRPGVQLSANGTAGCSTRSASPRLSPPLSCEARRQRKCACGSSGETWKAVRPRARSRSSAMAFPYLDGVYRPDLLDVLRDAVSQGKNPTRFTSARSASA